MYCFNLQVTFSFFFFFLVEFVSDFAFSLKLDMPTPTPIEFDDWGLVFALWIGAIDDFGTDFLLLFCQMILAFVNFYFDNILICGLTWHIDRGVISSIQLVLFVFGQPKLKILVSEILSRNIAKCLEINRFRHYFGFGQFSVFVLRFGPWVWAGWALGFFFFFFYP